MWCGRIGVLNHSRMSAYGRRKGSRGVMLIEVLVSILLASIALLALVGANVASIRYTKMSQYRGTATLLANDIGERMRANKAGVALNAYDLQSAFVPNAPALTAAAGNACNGYPLACAGNAVMLAQADIANWLFIVQNQLPEGTAFIVQGPVAGGMVGATAADVWLVWRDPSVAAADESPTTATECPVGLGAGADPSIRCSYFRINL